MKTAILTILLSLLSLLSLPAMAGTGPQDIAKTVHNLSTSGTGTYASTIFGNAEDQICIYCHTPHGGSLDGPLWNRNFGGAGGDGSGYTFYSSVSLGTEASSVAQINPESLLCLSCHDGSIGVGDSLINPSADADPPNNSTSIVSGAPGIPGPRIGGSRAPGGHLDTVDLSDDHPISFNYATAQGEANSQLHPIATPKGMGLRFYGSGEDNLECGTCHDPHVDYTATGDTDYAPFLAIPNTGSQMCLGCHDK